MPSRPRSRVEAAPMPMQHGVPIQPAALRRALLAWYGAGARDLPWRRTRDAYAIWISEAMLQQTRVETVLPYWERFLARFPSARALAAASEGEVLALWSGLGYYGRARKLAQAARELVERHRGEFPRTRDEALALAGVGPYTAGAVLSIAYGLPEPLVDGNVARVLCRLFALEGDPASAATKRELWRLAGLLVPDDGSAGDWNQALMELGATLCTPRAPRCGECPLAASCAALARGLVDELPRLRARRAPLDVELEILVVERRGRYLLERRPPGGRMAGLLQFPTRELVSSSGRTSGLFPDSWPRADGRAGLSAGQGPMSRDGSRRRPSSAFEAGAELGSLRHAITHHRIRAVVRAGRARFEGELAGCAWHAQARMGELELTGMAKKVARLCGRSALDHERARAAR